MKRLALITALTVLALRPLAVCAQNIPTYFGHIVEPATYAQFDVRDTGGCAAGVDNTAAVQATLTAAAAVTSAQNKGARVRFTCATLLNSSTVTIPGNNITLDFSGGGCVQVGASHANTDVFATIAGQTSQNIRLIGSCFAVLGSPTAGALIGLRGCNGCTIDGLTEVSSAGHAFDMIGLGAPGDFTTGIHIDHVSNATSSFTGAGLRLGCGVVGAVDVSNVQAFNGSGVGGSSVGFSANDSTCANGTLWDLVAWDNTDFENVGTGMDLENPKGSTLVDLFVSNWYCDAPQTKGCLYVSGNPLAGDLGRIKIVNSSIDAGPGANAITLLSPGGVGVGAVEIANSWLGGSTGHYGISIGQNVGCVTLTGDQIWEAGNPTAGIYADGLCLTVSGGRIGNPNNAFYGNTAGVTVGPHAGLVDLLGVIFVGNTTKAVTTTTPAGAAPRINVLNSDVFGYAGGPFTIASGTTINAHGNPGYNPVGAMTAPTVGASPWTYTNGSGVDQTVNVSGGTVTAISANGVVTGLTAGSFLIPAGATLVMTYSTAPSVTVSGN